MNANYANFMAAMTLQQRIARQLDTTAHYGIRALRLMRRLDQIAQEQKAQS